MSSTALGKSSKLSNPLSRLTFGFGVIGLGLAIGAVGFARGGTSFCLSKDSSRGVDGPVGVGVPRLFSSNVCSGILEKQRQGSQI
jgi:hypothetical protein